VSFRAWSRLALVVLGAAIFQVSVLDDIVLHHAHPDVMLLVAIGTGLAAGAQDGAVAAFTVGLVADLFVQTPYGVSSLTYVLVAFAVGLATAGPGDRPGLGMRFATAVLASAAGTMLFAGIGYILGEPLILRTNLVAVVGVVTAGNAILAIPVLGAVYWAVGSSKEERSESTLAVARAR
jgi:rod shape-determining protein MreD